MSSDRFYRTRVDHSRETAEDYLELIDSLIQECGEARMVDLATRFGISHVTVSKTVYRLKRDGFVTVEPYRSIFLTELGQGIADQARERHELVLQFLKSIGIDEEIAEIDAEGIEHHVSKQTLEAMKKHIQKSAEG